MSLIQDANITLFALKIFLVQHGLLSWSPSREYCYGHSGDVCKNVADYMLGLTVFILFENYDVWFCSYWV